MKKQEILETEKKQGCNVDTFQLTIDTNWYDSRYTKTNQEQVLELD